MLLTKSLNLALYPNYHKFEHLRYTSHKFKQPTQLFCNKLFITTKRFLSTEGRAFVCVSCGFTTNADLNAARNLAMKGHPILKKILPKYADYYSKAKVG